MRPRVTTRLSPAIAAVLLVAACSSAAGPQLSDGPAEITINPDSPAEPIEMTDDVVEESAPVSVATGTDEVDADLRQRCLEGIRILERRWDEEDFEYPDEGPELSEEELEQTMAPAQDFVDGVAGPGERPDLAAMPAFDPETMPIPQLDRFREGCFEHGLVTEAEVYGEEEGGDDDWCAELTALSAAEIEEFAAEDGEDIVREEFEACGLPSPLDS